jgi:hypothetical protein
MFVNHLLTNLIPGASPHETPIAYRSFLERNCFVWASPPKPSTVSGVEIAAAVMGIIGLLPSWIHCASRPTDVPGKWRERQKADQSKAKENQEGLRRRGLRPSSMLN